MKITLCKIGAFLLVFILLQLVVMPWIMENNLLPLWMDIILIAGLMAVWVFIIGLVARKHQGCDHDMF